MAVRAEEKKGSAKHECKWNSCTNRGPFSRAEELSRHIEREHFPAFESQEFVLCLWEGCKVYNRPCNNKSWLSNHIKLHTKERPHKCLMNGCSMAFCSVEALQNHLQLHFEPKSSAKALGKVKRRGRKRGWKLHRPPPLIHVDQDSSPPPPRKSVGSPSSGGPEEDRYYYSPECRKVERRRLSLRVRIPLHSSIKLSSPSSGSHHPVPINGAHIHTDLLDRRTMAVVKETVSQLARHCPSRDGICLNAQVIGRRVPCGTGLEEYLVRWSPRLVPDHWVPVGEFQQQKLVYLSDLTPLQKSSLTSMFFCRENGVRNSRKRKSSELPVLQ